MAFALLVLALIIAPFLAYAQIPYPQSRVITKITWAAPSTIVRQATGSDNWPMTWADDNNLYTAYGDGWGFEPKVAKKLSLGFAKVVGTAADFSGINIRSLSSEQEGGGKSGKKASGMLMLDGVLYMWVRNANEYGEQCQLAWSADYAKTWTWSNWKFKEFGYCVFLNFRKNYAGARDGYVYMYSPNTPSAYNETDDLILTRVAKSQIKDRTAYKFFRSINSDNNPVWTPEISQRESVFDFPGGINRVSVAYNTPLRLYLMTLRSRAKNGGLNQFSIYDAPEPWGPWTTVYYTESWGGRALSKGSGGWGESQQISSKWISASGMNFYLVFSGNDSFSVRKATLNLKIAPSTAD